MATGQNAGQAGARPSGADANREVDAVPHKKALPGTDSSSLGNSAHVPPRRVTMLRVAVALLLLTSATFKVHAIFTEPYFADSILGSPVWMVGLVECEILLGLWLLSGVALRAAWLAALVAFAGFACVNIYLLATGATTCGCFGTVETHPWVMLGLDLLVLGALLWCRLRFLPKSFALQPVRKDGLAVATKNCVAVAGLASMILVGLAFVAIFKYGSIHAGITAWRGEAVAIIPANLVVGSNVLGSSKTVEVEVLNTTQEEIRLVGAKTSCRCLATQDLPIAIPPNASRIVHLTVRFTGKPGPFRQQYVFWVDSPSQHFAYGRVSGVVLEAPLAVSSPFRLGDRNE